MKNAYVTMMCGGDAYLAGVEALGRSIVETGSVIPRVVMVTSDVSAEARAALTEQGWWIRDIEPIKSPHSDQEAIYARYAHSFTKLRVFELVEFDKVVFLDADTVVLSSIEELFDRPSLSAAPDFFMPDRFNSGVMVLDPSQRVFDELMNELGNSPSYDGGDQGLLNSHWPNWWSMPVEHRLSPAYNLHHFVYQFMSSHAGLLKSFGQEIKIIHYTLQKPWQQFTVSGGSQVWWEKFYSGRAEEHQGWRKRLSEFQDNVFDRFVGMLGG